MRRFTIGSAMVLALLLMLTAIATAAPPDFCDANPDHWKCPTTTTSSSTTTTTTPTSTLQPCETEFDIKVPKPGRIGYECLWTPDEPQPMPTEGVKGVVTVTPNGEFSQLVVYVRDASPGDICLGAYGIDDQISTDGFFEGSFDLSYGDLPDDAIWDPDNLYPDFAPYEHQNYWSFGGTHWCYPQEDAVPYMRPDLNGPPLHLWVGFKAKQDTDQVAVTLSVEPKNPDDGEDDSG